MRFLASRAGSRGFTRCPGPTSRTQPRIIGQILFGTFCTPAHKKKGGKKEKRAKGVPPETGRTFFFEVFFFFLKKKMVREIVTNFARVERPAETPKAGTSPVCVLASPPAGDAFTQTLTFLTLLREGGEHPPSPRAPQSQGRRGGRREELSS